MIENARQLIEKARIEKAKVLDLRRKQLEDISAIKDLTQLTTLNLDGNRISDISALNDLTQLTDLHLGINQISDISALKNLTQLTNLRLGSNQIGDISTLKNLTQLTNLYIGNNLIGDISPLEGLTLLSTINLCMNKITHLPSWIVRRKYKIKYELKVLLGCCTIYKNPFVHPPLEVVQQGHDAIVRFFEEHEKTGTSIYDANNVKKNESRSRPLKVFISYSKVDLEYAETLIKKYLIHFEWSGDIKTWYDRDMAAGAELNDEVKKNLEEADIILILYSPDSLSSAYIRDKEFPIAKDKYESGKAKVTPIILRDCPWKENTNPFAQLLALPDNGKPITTYEDEDEAWMKVFTGIKKLVDSLLHPKETESGW